MYPRNAASPERISVGAIYQISNGAIQTTGASVRVMPQGGAAAGGGGTLDCDTTSGIWHYTPTQAETNYTSFQVFVYKSACTSASMTIVTSAESTPGTVTANATKIGGQAVGLSSDNRLQVDVAEWNDVPLATTNPLPNAAADAAGGLPISDTGGLDMDAIPTAIATAQADLDKITGSDGATLATAQGNYAPAKAGDQMDLIDAPNATAVTAIQAGLSTYDGSDTPGTTTLLTRLVGTIEAGTHVAQSGDSFARLGAPAGASVSADIAELPQDKTGYALSTAGDQSVADAILIRAVSNVEDTADKHSLAAIVMISTNSNLAGGVLTAKKPSDDSTFFTYTVTSSASADNITGVN